MKNGRRTLLVAYFLLMLGVTMYVATETSLFIGKTFGVWFVSVFFIVPALFSGLKSVRKSPSKLAKLAAQSWIWIRLILGGALSLLLLVAAVYNFFGLRNPINGQVADGGWGVAFFSEPAVPV